MGLLPNSSLEPLAATLAFIRAPLARVRDVLLHDWGTAIQAERIEHHLTGDLDTLVRSLDPMKTPWDRVLAIETGTPWLAVTDNQIGYSDVGSYMPFVAERLRADLCLATATAKSGCSFSYSRAHDTGVWVEGWRVVYALLERRWEFFQSGTPFPFEETSRYAARRIRDRLTPEMMDRYLRALAIPRLDDSRGPLTGWVMELAWTHGDGPRTLTVAEAKALYRDI
jgi:hypothetical protein